MVIYTVTSKGLCCTDALSILHFAKLSDTSMYKIFHWHQPLLPCLQNKIVSNIEAKGRSQTAYTKQNNQLGHCLPRRKNASVISEGFSE